MLVCSIECKQNVFIHHMSGSVLRRVYCTCSYRDADEAIVNTCELQARLRTDPAGAALTEEPEFVLSETSDERFISSASTCLYCWRMNRVTID